MSEATPKHPPDPQSDYDPRAVSDDKTRAEHSREEVERWREEAQAQHERWLEVMNNSYGKD